MIIINLLRLVNSYGTIADEAGDSGRRSCWQDIDFMELLPKQIPKVIWANGLW